MGRSASPSSARFSAKAQVTGPSLHVPLRRGRGCYLIAAALAVTTIAKREKPPSTDAAQPPSVRPAGLTARNIKAERMMPRAAALAHD